MKRILLFSLLLLSCRNTVSGPTVLSPSPLPAISPSPSPEDSSPFILVSVSAKILGSGGSATSSFAAGQEIVLQGSVNAFDPATGKQIKSPPVAFWAWGNFSDPQAHCLIFGEDNSSHPHGKCDGQGVFMTQATAFGFDGKILGVSILFTALVF